MIYIIEKPRERFIKYGVESLSNTELLSILLRTGTKNKTVYEISNNLLNKYNINDFSELDYNILKEEYGLGEVKAISLITALEFGKRVYNKKENITKITNSEDAYNIIKNKLENEPQENFIVIYLNTKNNIIKIKKLFIGTINSSSIYPRDIFREAVRCNAYSMIISHNHPSGNIEPSFADNYLTNTMIKLGKMMNVYILDHLIIGKDKYYSYKENNPNLFN